MERAYLHVFEGTIRAMTRTWLIVAVLSLLSSLACRHRVYIASVPAGASLSLDGEVVGTTPQEVVVDWRLRQSTVIVAQVQDYRDMELNLSEDLRMRQILADALFFRGGRLSGAAVRTRHEVLFVREHGSSGTWSAEDARRN